MGASGHASTLAGSLHMNVGSTATSCDATRSPRRRQHSLNLQRKHSLTYTLISDFQISWGLQTRERAHVPCWGAPCLRNQCTHTLLSPKTVPGSLGRSCQIMPLPAFTQGQVRQFLLCPGIPGGGGNLTPTPMPDPYTEALLPCFRMWLCLLMY